MLGSTLKSLVGGLGVVEDKAPHLLDQCVPGEGLHCDGGWHFRDIGEFYGREAIGRCDTRRRQEIRAKVSEERARLDGPLEQLRPGGGAKFDGYDTGRGGCTNLDKGLAAMRTFASGRPPKRNVILVSPNGMGKTRLLLASHFTLLEAGIASQYVTTPELRKWFRRAMSFDEETEREARNWLDRFNYSQVVHFDDAGHVENDQRARGEFTEGLKSLLDNSKAAWAVATNRTSAEMETHPDLSGTVASRFQYQADIVVMTGPDFRVESSR